MNNSNHVPIIKDLILVGGGHSHLAVLKYFGMHPVPGLRLTLITRDLHTPYSGMLPGYIAGHYDYDQVHIDLRPLALFAKARIYHAEVTSIDAEQKRIFCHDRPPIHYDLVSINIGSTPSSLHIPGVAEFSIPVKPIDQFLSKWEMLVENVLSTIQQNKKFQLAIVGGGAGGIEIALATQYRLHALFRLKNIDKDKLETNIYCDSATILPTHNARVRKRFNRILQQRGINVHTNNPINKVEKNLLLSTHNIQHAADAIFWLTNAAAPAWLAETGLQLDENGFISVTDTLQSVSHEDVFAAGDIASVVNHPRAKSGVFAVRQGLPLAKNLQRAVKNNPLISFKPQKNFLGLISTGDQYAVASRSNWALEGGWLWKLKDKIDRQFMDNFNRLPKMKEQEIPQYNQTMTDQTTRHEINALAMRCGGCGAKVGSTILSRVIKRLVPINRDEVIIGLACPDDAAVSKVPPGKVIVQSVDYFRSFIDDPYLFGQIAANHALSDIFAMGADTYTAMAIATIPYGIEKQIEEQLFQMMTGALKILNASNTALVGGHSSEGAELSFGLSVTGLADEQQIMRKSGMQQGDVLILTKALGTGTLFAADMRLKAKGRWIDNALTSMLQSNQAAGICLYKHGATACTDVTGFGLLGHLIEMMRASATNVEINLAALPILNGAPETMASGIFSSLQEQNERMAHVVNASEHLRNHKHFSLLFDPQTSGGLLAAIPAGNADACLAELHQLNYSASANIGKITGNSSTRESVTLT
jgi:selenide,water dikinase